MARAVGDHAAATQSSGFHIRGGYKYLPRAIWGSVLLAAAYAVAAGPALKAHNSDSLIPVFVSLESWTLFYWGQNRFGMLLPLLALPVRSAFANLIVQNVLGVALLLIGLAAAFARFRVGRPALCALVVVTVLLSFREGQITLLLFTTNQSYAAALGCFGMAMFFCSGSSVFPGTPALALMILGAWANGGVGIFATVLALALTFVRSTRAVAVPMLVGTFASICAHRVLQTFASAHLLDTTPLVLPAASEAPDLLAAFWTQTFQMYGSAVWIVIALLWTGALGITLRDPTRRGSSAAFGALAVAAGLYGTLMALFLHGLGRHMMSALPVCLAAPFVVLATANSMSARVVRSPVVAAATIVWLLALTGLHRPSTARRELIAHLGQGYEAMLYAQRISAVTGDYWSVWPVVFATNLLHERETGRRPVLPIALRSEVLHRRLISRLNSRSVIAVIPSGSVEYWRAQPDFPELDIRRSRDGFDLARVAPKVRSARLVREWHRVPQ